MNNNNQSTKKKEIVKIFNRQLQRFVSEIKKTFPVLEKNEDIKSLEQTWLTTVTLSPDIIIKMYNEYVVNPYEKHLKKRNENFFIELETDNAILLLLQKVLSTADDFNKKAIWKYVESLTFLSDKHKELSKNLNEK